MTWSTDNCPICREPLPDTGNRRLPIPSLHGRRRLVHAACAETIVEPQLTLELGKQPKRPKPGN